jgi:hypothetical protein
MKSKKVTWKFALNKFRLEKTSLSIDFGSKNPQGSDVKEEFVGCDQREWVPHNQGVNAGT